MFLNENNPAVFYLVEEDYVMNELRRLTYKPGTIFIDKNKEAPEVYGFSFEDDSDIMGIIPKDKISQFSLFEDYVYDLALGE